MVPLALRTLLHDRIRLAIAIGGVSFAILLMLVLRGIMDGTVAKSTTYIDHVGADIFIAQQGVEHFALSTSSLPVQAEATAASAEGVARARGIISVPMVITLSSEERAIRLVGFDAGGGLGGPWSLSEGSAAIGAFEIVMDSALARDEGIGVGDRVQIGGQEFTIKGLSRQTNALAGKVVFVQRAVAAQMTGADDTISHVLVQIDSGAEAEAVADGLRRVLPDAQVMTREEFSENERSLLGSLFVTPVNVMATIGLLVGIMVVGLTIYTAAAERLRDFGVLKAIGASNRYIYGVIIRQALMIGGAGFIAGLGAGYLAKPLVEYFVPDLGIAYSWRFVLIVFGVSMFISLLSAILPVYRITGVDPKQVFKT